MLRTTSRRHLGKPIQNEYLQRSLAPRYAQFNSIRNAAPAISMSVVSK